MLRTALLRSSPVASRSLTPRSTSQWLGKVGTNVSASKTVSCFRADRNRGRSLMRKSLTSSQKRVYKIPMPLCSRVRKVRLQKVLLLRHPVPYPQPLPPLLLHKHPRPHQLLQAPTLLFPHNKCLLYLLSLRAARFKPLHQTRSHQHRNVTTAQLRLKLHQPPMRRLHHLLLRLHLHPDRSQDVFAGFSSPSSS